MAICVWGLELHVPVCPTHCCIGHGGAEESLDGQFHEVLRQQHHHQVACAHHTGKADKYEGERVSEVAND